jgi:UDP-galactopyranose mutase
MQFDWLIAGSGLTGAVFAHEAKKHGHRVLVVERRNHIGGNVYTENCGGIEVHRYGAHIFHTSDDEVWEYANRFADFSPFINEPLARYGDKLYHLPFNMNTFYEMWGVTAPDEAKTIIDRQRSEIQGEPGNLEEQAISMVGRDIYQTLVKGYTFKQWGKPPTELPASIIRRLPVRFTFNNNYFDDRWQGIPRGGYTKMVEALLDGIEVRLNTDYLAQRDALAGIADRIVFTGPIDQYFGYRFGPLEYRSLRFETVDYPQQNFQGNAVVNDTAADVPYTRIIEHKHFEPGNQQSLHCPHTVVTHEYPQPWALGDEPYYPINDARNTAILQQYQRTAKEEIKVIFGGRLGNYQYLDMDDTIRAALDLAREVL